MNRCKEIGCDKQVVGFGHCDTHYRQMKKYGKIGQRQESHGCSGTKLYNVWNSMKNRCMRESNKSYDRYGRRGISVCNEWRNSFTAFKDWAISNGYSKTLDIDRIDNDGNYEPSNCRFVTRKINALNTRNAIKYKLTEDDMSEAIECYYNSNITVKKLANKLNIGRDALSTLINIKENGKKTHYKTFRTIESRLKRRGTNMTKKLSSEKIPQ